MPFREKVAWISFLTLLGVFGPFFGAIAIGRLPSDTIATLHYLLISAIAFVGLQIVLRIAAMVLAHADAQTPKDERERLIELRAAQLAYWVLIAALLLGVFLVTHVGPFIDAHIGMPELGLTMLAALVLADLVRSGSTILQYRMES